MSFLKINHIGILLGVSIITLPFVYDKIPQTKTDKDIANINSTITVKYENYPNGAEPYTNNENCTIIKTDDGYQISSSIPDKVVVYKALGPFMTWKTLRFEEPVIEVDKKTVNIGDTSVLTVSNISTKADLLDNDNFDIELISNNQFRLIPKNVGANYISACINEDIINIDITVDNPSLKVSSAREKENATIQVSGVTTDYELETSDSSIGTITNGLLTCLLPGNIDVILTANGQTFTYPVQIEKHIHKWSEWETVLPTCTELGYDMKTCFCGETDKKNIVEALGHQMEHVVEPATCTKEGYEEDVCSVCQAVENHLVIEKVEHVPGDWVITEDVISPLDDGSQSVFCKNCNSELETKTYSYQEKVQSQKSKRWIYGRLSIPDVGVDVALIRSESQSVVDAKDSAAYFLWNGAWLIADHWNQGFDAIKRCKPGDICYIATGDTIEEYECIRMDYGHNTGDDLTENDWSTSVTAKYPGQIIMYTCNNGWQNIAFVVWKRIS